MLHTSSLHSRQLGSRKLQQTCSIPSIVTQQPRRVLVRHAKPFTSSRRAAVLTRAAAVKSGTAKPKVEHYIREMSPWPTDVPIVAHDPQKQPHVDLVIAGAGPSGLAVGERVARAGYKVCIVDPAPLGIWPANYGVWVDEFEAMGLGDCLEVIWPKAKVFLDSDNLGAK